MQNIIEYLREEVVKDLFELNSFSSSWEVWRTEIGKLVPILNPTNIVDLGDSLSDIFTMTGVDRSQSSVAGGGHAWEAIVCWYLNICLIGSRTVIIKQKKKFIPTTVQEALTVKYDSFRSNTEADLIAITFPNKVHYTSYDKKLIDVVDKRGNSIPVIKKNKYNYKSVIDALLRNDFNEIELGVIQCKTNWKDNAQIPMLWDMVYASEGFYNRNITVGSALYKIRNIQKFSYSFVTVPTNSGDDIKPTSTQVKRVRKISGGNYWGHPSLSGVSNSLKEIFGVNFENATENGLLDNLNEALLEFEDKYSYFRLK